MTARGYPQYYEQVQETVEELVDTPTIIDIYRRLASIAGSDVRFTYAATGDPAIDTPGVKAMIAAASGLSAQMEVTGTCGLALTPGLELNLSNVGANSSLTFVGPLIRYWDPANPDATLGGWITGTGTAANQLAPGFTLKWETIDYSPKPFWEGFVTAVDTDPVTGHFDVQMKPGFEPAFTTMRVFHGIVNDIWVFSQSEERNSAPGISYPVVPIGGGVYRVTPTVDTITVTGISSFNPLTVMGTGLDSERQFLASGFTGAQAANVNGHTYTFDLDQGSMTRGVLLENGKEVDATGWDLGAGTGTLTSPRIPTGVVVGLEMIGVCRKHGTPEIEVKYSKGWTVGGGRIKAATAVFLGPQFAEDLTITTLDFRGDGRMSCTGGGVVAIEPRGLLRFDSIYAASCGDDGFNQTPRYLNSSIASYTSSTITLNAAVRVWTPRKGDVFLFISPTKVRTKVPVTAVDTTVLTATVATVAVPVGFNPATWIVRNDSAKPRIRGNTYYGEGASRHFFANTDDCIVGSVSTANTRGASERAQDPKSGAHSTSGAMAGGLAIQNGKVTRGCMAYGSADSSAVYVYRVQGSTTPSGLPPIVLGSRTVDGYGFMLGAFEGVDVIFDNLTLLNPGLMRASTPDLVNDPTLPGNFDIRSVAQTTTIGQLNTDALLWLKISTLYGGNVVVANRGALALAITSDPGGPVAVNTLAYGSVRSTATLVASRTFTLSQAGAQNGDVRTIINDGSGGMIIKDETSGATLGTVNAGETGYPRNDGTRWN